MGGKRTFDLLSSFLTDVSAIAGRLAFVAALIIPAAVGTLRLKPLNRGGLAMLEGCKPSDALVSK
jgi:hypothetical protein